MAERYNANLKNVMDLSDQGVDLVWITSHANASPRCAPYQGKLYSISGKSGVIDGIRYTPLSEALASPYGDGNGIISGYNCRHRLVEYFKNSRAPKEYSDKEIKKICY